VYLITKLQYHKYPFQNENAIPLIIYKSTTCIYFGTAAELIPIG